MEITYEKILSYTNVIIIIGSNLSNSFLYTSFIVLVTKEVVVISSITKEVSLNYKVTYKIGNTPTILLIGEDEYESEAGEIESAVNDADTGTDDVPEETPEEIPEAVG